MKCDCTKAMCSSSCVECLPYFSSCVYMPYCGTCPVINLAQDDSFLLVDQGSLGVKYMEEF